MCTIAQLDQQRINARQEGGQIQPALSAADLIFCPEYESSSSQKRIAKVRVITTTRVKNCPQMTNDYVLFQTAVT